ncbi:dihydrofolate reductase [Pseudorhodobacter sp. E13]|uniref:dihydrofolate reductase family protein n=1 Tax=Pseudorhodobacter sp. E13 TaxID=2487931 RepID=UPI000F8F3D47|nr:dihydrofolate reductase family protein [Pseudorhodobacter sp. E13]RUS58875.1 dihydrofolate reductase [Pseudorhodobacter sp. E13]
MPLSCHAFVAASLDGFIARPDGGLDWLEPFNAAEEDHGYDAFIARMDGIIMGRGTYETVLGFGHWPYRLPVIVLSQSLTVDDIPDSLADHVAITDMDPAELHAALAEEGWQSAYVDGGQVIQSFINAGLLTDITLTRVPLLLGQGRPLFGPVAGDVALTLLESRSFPSGIVSSRYAIARP